jgi:hypothetical protein
MVTKAYEIGTTLSEIVTEIDKMVTILMKIATKIE